MKKLLIICFIVSLISAFRFAGTDIISANEVRPAIQSSLDLLQHSSDQFIENAGCYSCHGQTLGTVAFSYAAERGFYMQDSSSLEARQIIMNVWKKRRPYAIEHVELLGGDISNAYSLWAFGVSDLPPDKSTDFMVNQLLERQTRAGNWIGNNSRPPLEYYDFTATALTIYGINYYGRPGFEKKIKNAERKAIHWLMNTPAVNNEEKAFQLLGLSWAKADTLFISQQADELLKTQQSDGGWKQLELLETDAYATGQSLFALYECGKLKVTDTPYLKGVAFLLRTQKPDGSWRIRSRSHPFLPHVSSGFPYGADQFISAAGSNWATIALLMTVPKTNIAEKKFPLIRISD